MEERAAGQESGQFLTCRRERDLCSHSFSSSYPPAERLPVGVTGIYGTTVPLGSAKFAKRDAQSCAPSSASISADPIPGWLVLGSLWPGERFVLRVPERWNRRLVVAGTPGQRSEFSGDRVWSDPLLALGYAYVCGNKGLGDGAVVHPKRAGVTIAGARLPYFQIGLRHGLTFWQHAPGHLMEQWLEDFVAIARCAREIIADLHGRPPELTYAVGLSNGGYQVRRGLELDLGFDGGLAWNASLWTPGENALRQLPRAIAAMEAGQPERLVDLGFPPDTLSEDGRSLYETYLTIYWRATAWLHAMHLDPSASLAYGDVEDPDIATGWSHRMGGWDSDRAPEIGQRIQGFANTGHLRAKLIDLASSLDYLTPPSVHFAPYGRLVAAGDGALRYRSAIVTGAGHLDAPARELSPRGAVHGYPYVLAAFQELVAWVECGREPQLGQGSTQ